jgi:deoxyribonuclease V
MTHPERQIDPSFSVPEAKADQVRLRGLLRTQSLDLSRVRYALAIGVSYSERRKKAVAVATPMLITGGAVDDRQFYTVSEESPFPYVPGLFAYREGPAICTLLESLPGLPDLLVFGAQGTAHPRRFGLAAHLGVIYNVPTLGITRKLLVGRAPHLPETDHARAFVRDRSGSNVGVVCRFLARSEPVYSSPGHLTDLKTLVAYCDQVSSVRSSLPSALALVHERANRYARDLK